MSTFWDWFFITLAVLIVFMSLITWKMTVLAGIIGWVCAILEKIVNISNKNEHN